MELNPDISIKPNLIKRILALPKMKLWDIWEELIENGTTNKYVEEIKINLNLWKDKKFADNLWRGWKRQ